MCALLLATRAVALTKADAPMAKTAKTAKADFIGASRPEPQLHLRLFEYKG